MEAPAPARVLEHLPVAALVVGPDGRLLLANPRASELLRLGPDAAGRNASEALPRAAAAAIEGMSAEAGAAGRADPRTLASGTVPSTVAPLVIHAAALPDGGGVVVVIREAEAHRGASPPPAVPFPSKLGHDLKTPITSIKAYAEALQDLTTDPQAREFLKVIDEEADRLVAMINGLVREWRERQA